jgi:hypothetical protein
MIPYASRVLAGAILGLVICARAECLTAPEDAFAAIVSDLVGTASATGLSGPSRAIRVYDTVASGTEIDVRADSRVTIVFASGSRFQLVGPVKARVTRTAVVTGAGVRRLTPLPPLPRIAPIGKADRTAGRVAAIRVRAPGIGGLYPSANARARPEAIVLSFLPVEGAASYAVDVTADDGSRVFGVETNASEVPVPAGVLKPGRTYHWTVRTKGAFGAAAQGEAELNTLSSEHARARERLRASLESAGDARSLGFLAEIDRRLGLLMEARDELRRAVSSAPSDPSLREALARVDHEITQESR